MSAAARTTLQLEHSLPGRARLRVPKPRTPAAVARISEEIGASPRLRAIEVNVKTGSLLLSFSPDDPLDSILGDLRELGYAVQAVVGQAPGADEVARSRAAKAVKAAAVGANRQLHAQTGGQVDLRFAIPAVFAVMAARQLVRDTRSIWNAPWYQLAYWAFDAFEKLNRNGSQ